MNGLEFIERIRSNPAHKAWVKKDTKIGIRSFYVGKDAASDDKNPRDVVAIANTDDVDSSNEIVIPSGADTSYFFAEGQKKIFVDHWYDFGSNVGFVRSASPFPSVKDHRAWRLRIQLYENMRNPLPDDILSAVKQAGLGLSIGFVPMEYGPATSEERAKFINARKDVPDCIIRRWKWLEVSFTAMPCNVACQTLKMSIPTAAKDLSRSIRVAVHEKRIRDSSGRLAPSKVLRVSLPK